MELPSGPIISFSLSSGTWAIALRAMVLYRAYSLEKFLIIDTPDLWHPSPGGGAARATIIAPADDLARIFDWRDATVSRLQISHANLRDLAREDMYRRGFQPDFSEDVRAQVADLEARAAQASAGAGVRDLRDLVWSSIDNDTSRDLDQIQVAESLPNGATRLLIGIAD